MVRPDDDGGDSPTEFRPSVSGSRRISADSIEIYEDDGESGDLEAGGHGYADDLGKDGESLADRVAALPRDRSSPLGEDERLINHVDADRVDLDTDGHVRSHTARVGRKLLTRVLPIALLVGVTAWSLYEIRGLEKPGREPKRPEVEAPALDTVNVPREPQEPGVASQALVEEVEVPVLGKKVGKLLEGVELERIRPPDSTETITVSEAVVDDGVTVINLWATWCGPCRRELPGFKSMFERGKERWGDKVRFVPIRVDDSQDEIYSYDKFVDEMPATHYFLIDNDIGGGVREPLVAAEIIRKKQSLPVTIVLDCRQSIRWHHAGEIKGAAFAELELRIDELRQEPASYCRKTRPKAKDPVVGVPDNKAETTPSLPGVFVAPPKTCGDGKCGVRENCHSCVNDCGCPGSQECKRMFEMQCPPGKPCKQTTAGWFCKERID